MKMTLSDSQRIRSGRIFDEVRNHGKFLKGECLNVWVYQSASESLTQPSKLGIVVSRKTHSQAVKRNLWKRRIREAFRCQQALISPGYRIVVQSKKKSEIPPQLVINKELIKLLTGAGVIARAN